MQPKTLHVLGGGQWQLPTIERAKKLGYRVLVTDMYEERPGYAVADAHERIDISDREATLRAAERHKIDGIVCDTTDVGVPTMAYVAEQLSLPGIGLETALNFTDKGRMRHLVKEAGIPSPPFSVVTGAGEARRAAASIGFPLVVKPVDNQSSRGVHIVRDSDGLEDSVADALAKSRAKRSVIEGFVEGVEVTVESFICDSKMVVAGISDKTHFAHRPEVANRLTYPANLSAEMRDRLVAHNNAVLKALGLKTGIAHAEYIVTADEAFLLEIAARGAGSFVYSDIVPYLVGADVPSAYIEYVVTGDMSVTPTAGERAAALAFLDLPPGRVKSIDGVDAAWRVPGMHKVLLEFSAGDELKPPEDDRSRPGLVVAFGSTRAEVLASSAAAMEAIRVQVE